MTTTPSEPTKKTVSSDARSAARLGAVQALYQMDVAATPLDDVIDEFIEHRFGQMVEGEQYPQADETHFDDIVRGVVREQREIDVAINESLAKGWSLPRLDATLRAIMRAGTYELRRCKDVPLKVIINEYVDVAHAFFEGDEPGVVNGVLDGLGRKLRPAEAGKAGGSRNGSRGAS